MTVRRGGAMHVATIRRQYKGKLYETQLLRRSYRENGKVRNETLANLSHLPEEVLELVRRGLAGDRFVPAGEATPSSARFFTVVPPWSSRWRRRRASMSFSARLAASVT